MGRRQYAVAAAGALTFALVAPLSASADTAGSTLYVNNASASGCSNSGPGTEAVPFCTIQAAVAVVNPGQTVYIERGVYGGEVDITRSGTASAPITITGPTAGLLGPLTELSSGSTIAHDIAVSGARYVTISDLILNAAAGDSILISGSSHVTLDGLSFSGSGRNPAAPKNVAVAHVTSGSAAVTIERSRVYAATFGPSFQIDGGSTGTVVTTNSTVGDLLGVAGVIAVDDAPGTAVTSNSVSSYCDPALSLANGSSGATVENNTFSVAKSNSHCVNSQAIAGAVVADAGSATGSTEGFNLVDNALGGADYSWSGVAYQTPAAFAAATGQGAHDLDAATPAAGIDGANSDAPGELSTDFRGNSRVDDPVVANTGSGTYSYYDIGAIEQQEPLQVPFDQSAGRAPVGGTVTFSAQATDPWASSFQYVFDFGDGVTVSNSTGTATHAYAATGVYTPTVKVTSSFGGSTTRNASAITVDAPAPLVPGYRYASVGGLMIDINWFDFTTDGWNPVSATIDFGDGSAPFTTHSLGNTGLNMQANDFHKFAKPGTYSFTLTVTDAGGNTASTTGSFTTTGSDFTPLGPVRILDTRYGTGTGGKVARVGQGGVIAVKVAGANAVPANATAVAMNVTLTNSSGFGNVAVAPTSQTPSTSNLNYAPGQTVANYVVVPIGPDGDVYLTKAGPGTVDLIADVAGYFTRSASSGFASVSPQRILDTRSGIGAPQGKVAAGAPVNVMIAGNAGVPAGATAVALNLTLTNSTGSGFVEAYPGGSTQPNASNVNYTAAGQTVAGYAIVPLGADGSINLAKGGPGAVDLIADVSGYFGASAPSAYVPLTPTRLVDSRSTAGPLAGLSGTVLTLPPNLIDSASTPPLATAAVVNVTATQTTSAGYLALQPGDSTGVPSTSSLNWTGSGQTVPNLAIAAPDVNDSLRIYNGSLTQTQYIVDLFGYFTAS